MTTMTHSRSHAFSASELPASLWARFNAWTEQRRKIARITRELNTYSDRNLSDLGLSRHDIPQVARGRIAR